MVGEYRADDCVADFVAKAVEERWPARYVGSEGYGMGTYTIAFVGRYLRLFCVGWRRVRRNRYDAAGAQPEGAEQQGPPERSHAVTPARVAEASDSLAYLRRRLPVEVYRSVAAVYLDGMTIEDAADSLGISPGTVSARILQARKKVGNKAASKQTVYS